MKNLITILTVLFFAVTISAQNGLNTIPDTTGAENDINIIRTSLFAITYYGAELGFSDNGKRFAIKAMKANETIFGKHIGSLGASYSINFKDQSESFPLNVYGKIEYQYDRWNNEGWLTFLDNQHKIFAGINVSRIIQLEKFHVVPRVGLTYLRAIGYNDGEEKQHSSNDLFTYGVDVLYGKYTFSMNVYSQGVSLTELKVGMRY